MGLTALTAVLLYYDGELNRQDGVILIFVFLILVAWTIYTGIKTSEDPLADVVEHELAEPMSMKIAVSYTVLGLIFLVISSRMLVWGGVEIAEYFGISDLLIGLTIVAEDTSLPELASSIAAVRKNEHDLAIGNIIGSNMFNTTIVLGITGTIAPTVLERDILIWDFPVLAMLTIALFMMGYNLRGTGKGIITRNEGFAPISAYVLYNPLIGVRALS